MNPDQQAAAFLIGCALICGGYCLICRIARMADTWRKTQAETTATENAAWDELATALRDPVGDIDWSQELKCRHHGGPHESHQCSRYLGHAGDHMFHARDGVAVHVWPNEDDLAAHTANASARVLPHQRRAGEGS